MALALAPLPASYRALMFVAWTLEAAFLSLLPFLATLPLRKLALYRWVMPAASALFVAVMAADAALHEAMAFHINGLILRMLLSPGAFAQIGIPASQLAVFFSSGALFIALDIVVGGWFIRRFEGRPWKWRYLALILLVPITDRLLVATLQFTGGRAMFAAGDVLPLQVPFRMNKFLSRVTGRPRDQGEERLALSRAPTDAPSLSADSIRFSRRPDVVLVLIESLREDFFRDSVMPRLSARAAQGTRFDRHYAGASSTHYTLFSIMYGQNAWKLEATVGAARAPLLFGAMRGNGYHTRLLTASSVDWMGMRQTVFRDVADDLETEFPGDGMTADSGMLDRARQWVAGEPADQPLFLVLFFGGTHFNYPYPPRSRRFTPDWDGVGSITAARVEPLLMKRRAMNSAHEVDWKLDDFLAWFAERRGRHPLAIITGDHGEAFREHGRVGHGAGVAEDEIHVPMVLIDDSVRAGQVEQRVTGHIDIVPTLFHLLGDRTDPARYADGAPMTAPPAGRFIAATAGWIPRYAVVGESLKAQFFSLDAGLGGVDVSDPEDQPLAGGSAMLRANAAAILRALRR